MIHYDYLAIDLKSFYASVECMERGLNPLTTNLVVADPSRTDKTICLAVSPSLKKWGIPGRPRLFEVNQRIRELNALRRKQHQEPITFIIAPPRMALYLKYSSDIYNIYLKYISAQDMHVYSIDEVFFHLAPYTKIYQISAHELARKMIDNVLKATGITATAGLGTNLYLCKIAMDIVAKHLPADKDGVRIAQLDEIAYRKQLWEHTPLTDFWRVGKGYQKKLSQQGLHTMGDIALCSLGTDKDYYNEDLLYRLLGINAQLLIDHAWGYEPCTIELIKAYKPSTNSLSSGQVLQEPYSYAKAKIIVREMAEALAYDLLSKHLCTKQLVLTLGYDRENLSTPQLAAAYTGPITIDNYGRKIPAHSHGTENLEFYSSSAALILEAATRLFTRIANPSLLVRRVTIVAAKVLTETQSAQENQTTPCQLDLFAPETKTPVAVKSQKSKKAEEAVLNLKRKYGSNAVLKAADLLEGATARDRSKQIGGHKA